MNRADPICFRFCDPVPFKVKVDEDQWAAPPISHCDMSVSFGFRPGKVAIIFPLDNKNNYIFSLEKNRIAVFSGRYGDDSSFNNIQATIDVSSKAKEQLESAYTAWENVQSSKERQKWYQGVKYTSAIASVAFYALFRWASLFQEIKAKRVLFALGVITTLGAYFLEKWSDNKFKQSGRFYCECLVRAAYYLHKGETAEPTLKTEFNERLLCGAERINRIVLGFVNDSNFPDSIKEGWTKKT